MDFRSDTAKQLNYSDSYFEASQIDRIHCKITEGDEVSSSLDSETEYPALCQPPPPLLALPVGRGLPQLKLIFSPMHLLQSSFIQINHAYEA